MWGDWLVYGTALGVGDRVAEAMRDLNVNIDVARFYPLMPLWFRPIIVRFASSRLGAAVEASAAVEAAASEAVEASVAVAVESANPPRGYF